MVAPSITAQGARGTNAPVTGFAPVSGTASVRVSGPASAPPVLPAASDAPPTSHPEEILRDYRALYPGVPDKTFESAMDSKQARAQLSESFAADPTYAGSWMDFATNTWHVSATSAAAASSLVKAATDHGVAAVSNVANFSYKELDAVRQQVGNDLASTGIKQYSLRVDAQTNVIELIVGQADSSIADKYAGDARITIIISDSLPVGVPAGCVSRNYCLAPLGGGINLGEYFTGSGSDAGCSIGFTGIKTASGQRYVYTAGHCILQPQVDIGQLYGNGDHYIGDARRTRQDSIVDVAMVGISNSYWTSGGYMYGTSLSSPVNVDYAILYASTIEVGDTVCWLLKLDRATPGSWPCSARLS